MYELVCVIDTTLSSKDIDALKAKIEKELPDVKEVDDIGLLPLAYPLRGQEQAYFVSYHLAATNEQVEELRSMLRLEKGVAKFVFYVMREQDSFLKFGDLQKSFDAIVEAEEAAKQDAAPVKEEAVEEEKEIIAEDVVADAPENEETTEEA